MAMLTHPGSRADLLLTLARLALPDAVRRANQPLAVAIPVAVLFLVFATVATLGLLPAIFAIESDVLRKNLLSLIACSVTALALLVQVLLRVPVTWLLDLEDLLRLPVGFRDLYGLRFALSAIGYWFPVLGPAGVYLAVARSGGVSGAPITLFALLSLVWIFGRTAAILSLLISRSVEGKLGALALVAIIAACQGAIMLGLLAFAGDLDPEGIIGEIQESAVLGGLGYTPPGLVAGIVHQPGPSLPNLARLSGLLVVLGALAVVENRLLLRSYLERPGGDRRVASRVLPLARILRRSRRLTPMATLSMLETEGLLRLKPARLLMAAAVAFALVWVPANAGLTVGLAGILALALHGFRVERQPPTCHVWKESLGLPLAVARIFRATGRAPSVVSVFILAFILSLTPLDWFGWSFFLVASCLMLAGLLLTGAAYGLMQVHWPQRSAGPRNETNAAKFAASLVLPQFAFASSLLAFPLHIFYAGERLSPLAAGVIATAVLLLAAAAAYASRRRQARVLKARGPELLLADPPETGPATSDHASDGATDDTVHGPRRNRALHGDDWQTW